MWKPFPSCPRSLSSVLTRQLWLSCLMWGCLFSGSPLFAASFLQEECLHQSPAGIALQQHLTVAKSGNAHSMFCAGAIHLYIQRDVNKALPWLEKAANAGEQRSPLVLGILYEKGTGVAENPATAAKWYRKGMENGNPGAVRRLAELYRLGLGVPHDEAKARELLDKAVAMGDKAAPLFIEKHQQDRLHPKAGQDIKEKAYRAYKQKRFQESAKLYRQCADMGNDQCQLALGVQFEFGEGVPQNASQAVAWYGKSAEQGNAIAQKTLGLMYELGKGVPENWAEAVRLYSKSAESYEEGAFALARMYEFGMAVPQNRAQAIDWFKKAEALGHPKGAYWARWLNDYTNCIGFRNELEQRTLGFLRCPADPVGVTFHNSGERLTYLRQKGKEFDKMEAEALARRAARGQARDKPACNSAGGVWTGRDSASGGFCQ